MYYYGWFLAKKKYRRDGGQHTFQHAFCRCKKFHWRWPGNRNGRSKFRYFGLFKFTRSHLTLQRRLRGWLAASRDRSNGTQLTSKHRREYQDRSKFCKYENLCIRDQAKRLEKLLFAATNDAAIDGIAHCFFFLLSLPTAFVFTFKK